MKVLFLTFGTNLTASSRVRIYQHIPYLEKEGIETKVCVVYREELLRSSGNRIKDIVRSASMLFYRIIKLLYCFFLVPWYDIVFIQKILLPTSLQKVLKRLKHKIIFDFDDAIYRVHPRAMSLLQHNTRLKWFAHMLEISSCTIVGSNHLKEVSLRYNDNILIIPSPIDIWRYYPRKKERGDNGTVIGWIGSPPNTVYLEPLYNVFRALARKYPALTIQLVGSNPITLENVNIVNKKWRLETEVADLQNFDIGIMPLLDDEWSRGKGGYKLLQYMAVGIPCVASPIGINTDIIRDGLNGFLVETEEEWLEKLLLLIESPEIRQKMGHAGRKFVERCYSFEVISPRLVEVLQRVMASG